MASPSCPRPFQRQPSAVSEVLPLPTRDAASQLFWLVNTIVRILILPMAWSALQRPNGETGLTVFQTRFCLTTQLFGVERSHNPHSHWCGRLGTQTGCFMDCQVQTTSLFFGNSSQYSERFPSGKTSQAMKLFHHQVEMFLFRKLLPSSRNLTALILG